MAIDIEQFRVGEGEAVSLAERPTRISPIYDDKRAYRAKLDAHIKALADLQYQHYAADRSALLVILQGMDASGKDSAIRHVMSGANPQGCRVESFKHPSGDQLQHDFLWKANLLLPARGQISIFNRSYYEEVLIVRVHPELLGAEGLAKPSHDIWRERYRSITDFEDHLARNGMAIVKIYLHLSKDEQKKRFLERLENPEKNWKFSLDDIAERKFWADYMRAYEHALSATSTDHAPWYVVPADDKKSARLIISSIVLHALKRLHPEFPKPSPEQSKAFAGIRKALERESETERADRR